MRKDTKRSEEYDDRSWNDTDEEDEEDYGIDYSSHTSSDIDGQDDIFDYEYAPREPSHKNILHSLIRSMRIHNELL